MKHKIFDEIVNDLAESYRNDDSVLYDTLSDVITDALSISNRQNNDTNLLLLKGNIKKAVKSIYLRRGAEGISSSSQPGFSDVYEEEMDIMLKDIIRQNKRLLG